MRKKANRTTRCEVISTEALERRVLFDAFGVTRSVIGHVTDAHHHYLENVRIGCEGSIGNYNNMLTDPDVLGSKSGAILDGNFSFGLVKCGVNIYDRGEFQEFRPQTTRFNVTATDLLGNKYFESFEFTLVNDTHPPERDPTPIQIPDLVLSEYDVVNPNGSLVLQNNHVMRPRNAKMSSGEQLIYQSPRYQEELQATARKLGQLGFCQDDSGAILRSDITEWGVAPLRATKLFQAPSFDPSNPDRSFNNAVDDPTPSPPVVGEVGARTLKQLNQTKTKVWTKWKTQTSGISLKSGAQPWMTTTVASALQTLSGTHTITDASKATGGKFGPHASHSVGLAFDTRSRGATGELQGAFYRPLGNHPLASIPGNSTGRPSGFSEYTLASRTTDIAKLKQLHPAWSTETCRIAAEEAAFSRGKRWIVANGYDREKTREYLLQLAQLPNEKLMYFNDPVLLADRTLQLAHLQPMDGHHDHIHVGFYFKADGPSGFTLPVPLPQSISISGGIDRRLNKDGDQNFSDHTLTAAEQQRNEKLLRAAALGIGIIGASTAKTLLLHFLDGTGTSVNIPSDSLLARQASSTSEFMAVRDRIFAQLRQGLRATIVPGGTGKVFVHPNPATDLVAWSNQLIDTDLALAFHGTQGLKVTGSLQKQGAAYTGFVDFTVLDVYGFGRSDISLPLETGAAAIRQQNHGNAKWFNTAMTIRVPFSEKII